jgi:hypothetical protein
MYYPITSTPRGEHDELIRWDAAQEFFEAMNQGRVGPISVITRLEHPDVLRHGWQRGVEGYFEFTQRRRAPDQMLED